jgi:t-SNARE complex subunit (syntaxin)
MPVNRLTEAKGLQSLRTVSTEKGEHSDFFEMVDRIRKDISKLSGKSAALQKLQKSYLSSLFNDEQELLQRQITKLTNNAIKLIAKINQDLTDAGDSTEPLRANQIRHLTRRFRDATNDFQTNQIQYQSKLEDQFKRQYRVVAPEATEAEIDESLKNGTLSITDDVFGKAELEAVQCRHKDLMSLEKTIVEIHQLFLQLSVLVQSQDEMIISIEDHVGKSYAKAKTAVLELKDAANSQRKARRRRWYIIIFCLILLAIFSALFYIYIVPLIEEAIENAKKKAQRGVRK